MFPGQATKNDGLSHDCSALAAIFIQLDESARRQITGALLALWDALPKPGEGAAWHEKAEVRGYALVVAKGGLPTEN